MYRDGTGHGAPLGLKMLSWDVRTINISLLRSWPIGALIEAGTLAKAAEGCRSPKPGGVPLRGSWATRRDVDCYEMVRVFGLG